MCRAKAFGILACLSACWKMSRAMPRRSSDMKRNYSGRAAVSNSVPSCRLSVMEVLTNPVPDSVFHFAEATVEEMVGALDQDKLFRLGNRGHQLFQFSPWPELVARAAQEELGTGTTVKK